MLVTLEEARRLFDEAYAFFTGKLLYVAETSELRVIAVRIFHKANVVTLKEVCAEIFCVIANHCMSCERTHA